MKTKTYFYFGLLLLLVGLIGLLVLDLPLRNHRSFTLISPDGESLAATYYPGSISKGVLLLEGFGSDQHMLRSLVRDLTASGLHVFTFDYSGHGYSPGALTYDNASTARLASQVQTAMTEFQNVSGLGASQIIWLGHSLGARVALQSAVLGPQVPSRLVLLGAQVNLGTNAQSEFFTGTTDADLAWVQSLNAVTPPVPILLITGTWEDILTVEGAQLLMTKLCAAETTTCDGASPRQWVLLKNLVHNYEVYSPRVLATAGSWAFPELPIRSSLAFLRIALWFTTVIGIFMTLIGSISLLRNTTTADSLPSGITVTNPKKLVWGRLLLWLIALPLSGLIMFLYVLIPLPSPTFNLIYGGFLGGYGLLIFLLYWFGKMPGVTGRLRQFRSQGVSTQHGWRWALLFNLALFVSVTLLYRSGIGLVPPMGVRFVWVVIFVPLTALGFWLGMLEADALRNSAPDKPIYRLWIALIGLVPFYIYLILLWTLGSTSGVLGSLTGLLILALSLLQGEINRMLTGNALVSAVLQALLIFWLILPAGALFVPFF